MPILWDEYTYPKHQPLPRGFIEDQNWAHEHIGEFIEKYPNQWVAVPLSVKANLIDDDSLPLILGFEDVITEVLLVSDFQQSIAYIIFRH